MQRRQALALGMASVVAGSAAAQTAPWPNKPLRMVIPWPPGQATDLIGRIIAQWLTERLGQNVVPENRGGAGGMIGTDVVAKSPPDGYALLSASIGPITFAPLVNRPPYNVERELAPVVSFGLAPYMLLVRPNFPATDARAFVRLLKANPGKYSYASSGIGGAQHLLTAMFLARAGLEALHVPFQGGAPALTALLAGQVQALSSGPGPVAAHVRDGRLRVLASWGAQRFAEFPQAPTLLEKGFAGCEYYIWCGVFAPAATPAPVKEALRAGMAAVARDPEVQRALAAGGNTLDYRDGAAFESFFRADAARLAQVVRRIGKVE